MNKKSVVMITVLYLIYTALIILGLLGTISDGFSLIPIIFCFICPVVGVLGLLFKKTWILLYSRIYLIVVILAIIVLFFTANRTLSFQYISIKGTVLGILVIFFISITMYHIKAIDFSKKK